MSLKKQSYQYVQSTWLGNLIKKNINLWNYDKINTTTTINFLKQKQQNQQFHKNNIKSISQVIEMIRNGKIYQWESRTKIRWEILLNHLL